MTEAVTIHITGAKIIQTDTGWNVYWKDQFIKSHTNKAGALMQALSIEDLELAFDQRYQKTA